MNFSRAFAFMLLLTMLTGCTDDPLRFFAHQFNHGKVKHDTNPTCRRCGMELSKVGNCTDMSCPFFKIKQNCLTDQEKALAAKAKELYKSLPHDDAAEKFRDREVENPDKMCCACAKKTTRVVLYVSNGDKDYIGPFRCCSDECEGYLSGKISRVEARTKE